MRNLCSTYKELVTKLNRSIGLINSNKVTNINSIEGQQLVKRIHSAKKKLQELENQVEDAIFKGDAFVYEQSNDNFENEADLLKQYHAQEKKQAENLEEFSNLLNQVKKNNMQLGDELERQNPQIAKIGKSMDRVNDGIAKTHNRLKEYVEKTSNTCLYTGIVAQIVILFVLLVLL